MEGWVWSNFFNLGPILGPIFGACIVQFLGFQVFKAVRCHRRKKLSTQLLRNLTEHAANLAITAVGGMTQDTANERINQKTTIKWTGHLLWKREDPSSAQDEANTVSRQVMAHPESPVSRRFGDSRGLLIGA